MPQVGSSWAQARRPGSSCSAAHRSQAARLRLACSGSSPTRDRIRGPVDSAGLAIAPPQPRKALIGHAVTALMVASAAPVSRGVRGLTVAGVGALLVAGAVFVWLRQNPTWDPTVVVPYEHFAIVSVVSLLAFGLALMLALAALQIAQYRVLFLALGFMAMGGVFAVHGISTPGILKSGPEAHYAGAVVGISAYLSLFVPAGFFAASYTGVTASFERRLPFSPAGWLVVVLATALGLYLALALADTELLAR